MRRSKLAAATLALFLAPTGVFAGVIAPGDAVTNVSADLSLPTGSPLAEKVVPFSIFYGPPIPALGFSGQLEGSFRSSVYQEAGGLTFLYSVTLSPEDGISGAGEASNLSVASFKSFKTDVAGALQFEDLVAVSRSADGSTVQVKSDTPGLGGAPTLLIRTGATKFAASGSASFFSSDEVPDLSGNSRSATGEVTFNGMLQPVDGSNGPPNAIPLPPAVYSGLGLLFVLAVVGLSRKTPVRII